MASGLLLLLDDVASLLDDVAALTKVAAKKTAGVLGDDLALNAQQVTGVRPARELPVVWAVARGSAVNKAILVPAALVVSWLAPWAVTPLLMAGGAYLCFEGVEKILHRLLHPHEAKTHAAAVAGAVADPVGDPLAVERDRIRGAIRTDFILSAEIIVITLGVVAAYPLATRVGVLMAVAVAMTVGVYGLVAAIVKLDDLGTLLVRRGGLAGGVGRAILWVAPWLMKGLSIAGTAAMFLVGGGIIAHGVPAVAKFVHDLASGPAAGLLSMGADAVVGVAVGLVAFAAVAAVRGLLPRSAETA
jgi:predicted DNA repair protein MutK